MLNYTTLKVSILSNDYLHNRPFDVVVETSQSAREIRSSIPEPVKLDPVRRVGDSLQYDRPGNQPQEFPCR